MSRALYRNAFTRHFLIVAYLLGTCVLAAQSKSVPPGFANLLGPQRGAVDIFYQGRFVTTVEAVYTTDSLRIIDPKILVDQLHNVSNQQTIVIALQDELDANSALLCAHASQTECGHTTPEIAAVIFDESNFRADLFINPTLLQAAEHGTDRFLSSSSAGSSIVQNLSFVASGNDTSQGNYSVYGQTVLALKESSITADWDFTTSAQARLNSSVWHRDYRARQLGAGLFRTSGAGPTFSSGQKVLGVRAGTSSLTRLDNDQLSGSRIALFFNSRARVDIFREDRLLSSANYPAGNQLIETADLPNGAYEITLKITEDSGRESTSTRYFVKAGDLPARGQTEYFVEAGRALDDENKLVPEDAQKWLFRGGFRRRLSDAIGFDLSSASTGDNSLIESSLTRIGSHWRASATLMGSTDGDTGYALSAHADFGFGSLSADMRSLARSIEPAITSDEDTTNFPFSLLTGSFRQFQVGLGIAVAGGNLSLRSAYVDRPESSALLQHTIAYSRPIRQSMLFSVQLGMEQLAETESINALLGLQYFNEGRAWRHQLRPTVRVSKLGSVDESSFSSVDWYASRRWANLDKGSFQLSTRGSADTLDHKSLGLNANFESDRGNILAYVNTLSDEFSGSKTNYLASASTSLLTDFSSFGWGGRTRSASAAMIEIEGDLGNTDFTVLVDDVPQAKIKAGRNSVINLSPYNTYNIRLQPSTEKFVNYSEQAKRITLYPGNVVKLHWQAAEITIGYGQIIDSNGQAIRNAVVEGAIGSSFTDDSGIFQAEIYPETQSLTVIGSSECRVRLPKSGTSQNGISNFGKLICT